MPLRRNLRRPERDLLVKMHLKPINILHADTPGTKGGRR